MAETKIEWADYTFNPWVGCTKVSEACRYCYAERDFDTRKGFAKWGPTGTRVRTSDTNWAKPLAWNHKALSDGVRRRVFCASLADVFEDWPGPISDSSGRHLVHTTAGYHAEDHEAMEGCSRVTIDDLRADLFRLIDKTPMLDWLLLTKRPENIRRMLPPGGNQGYRENVWLGTSIEDQATADTRIPKLLSCGDFAKRLFVSAEPLLGPVTLMAADKQYGTVPLTGRFPHGKIRLAHSIDWVIAGGESGPHARPSHPDWFRSLRDECTAAGVPFLFKQWGEWAPVDRDIIEENDLHFGQWHAHPTEFIRGCICEECLVPMARIGKRAAGRLLDGREWNEVPT